MSLSRKILSQKPPHHLPASITVFLLMSFLVFLAPKTAYPLDVTLTWSANTESDLAGYRIYHREEGQAYDHNYPLWEGIDTTCTIYNLDDSAAHYFVARAFDIYWNESEDSVEVSLQASVNMPPTADAGPDHTADEGIRVALNGSNSADPDGTLVSYSWAQIGGVAVTLSETWAAQPNFTAPDVGSEWILLTFQVTITDDGGLQSQDTCIVQVAPLDIESPGSALYVSGVTIELRQMGRLRRSRRHSNYEARAYLVVLDEFGMLVSGASIRGDWAINGVSLNASFGTTTGAGEARLDSNRLKAESGDTFTLTVTEITKDGYTYDPYGNTHSITVP